MEAFATLIGTLMQSRNQAHIFHLQAQAEGSYAAHKALEDYYDGIIGLIDDVVESVQGRYGIVTGYKMAGTIREDREYVLYFEALCKLVEGIREQIWQDSYIQNQIDEIVALIEKTKYKLKFLH